MCLVKYLPSAGLPNNPSWVDFNPAFFRVWFKQLAQNQHAGFSTGKKERKKAGSSSGECFSMNVQHMLEFLRAKFEIADEATAVFREL